MGFLYSFLVVAVDVLCVSSWMSRKCMVLDEASPYPTFPIQSLDFCPGQQLRASCGYVSDFAADLSTIPNDINALCVWVDHGSTLQPNALTKFHSLRNLYIYGCLSAILPNAFRGLTNLHLLSLVSQKSCIVSVPSKVFHDLYNLQELRFKNYLFSGMAADAFYGLIHMKRLDVKGSDNFSEILCKLSYSSASLEYLNIELDVETITTPDCTYGPNQFLSLKKVSFLFPHLMNIERNAFKHIGKLLLLSMPMNNVLNAQLLQSGIQQIDKLDLYLTETNIQSICEVVFALSVTIINLHFNTLQEYSKSSWKKCHKLEEIILSGQNLKDIELSFMSNLKNLNIFVLDSFDSSSIVEDDMSLMSLCRNNASLSSLRRFSYSTEQNLTLGTREFDCLHHLESLYIQGANILLEEFAFEGFQYLEKLSFKTNNLTVNKYSFGRLMELRVLSFEVILFVIKPELFSGLLNVQNLFLKRCSIQIINDFAFRNLSQLKYINLCTNAISKITTNTFFGLYNLETLILDRNPIKELEPSSLAHFPLLKVLNLGTLKFSSAGHRGMETLNLSLIFGKFPRQLSNLTIKSAVRPMTLIIADDSTPEVGLSLSLFGQKIVIWGCERPFLKSVTKLDVLTDFFLCAPNYFQAIGYFTSLDYLDFAQFHASVVQNLSGLNRLVNLKRLDLGYINLINQPDISLIFHNLTKLESLSLSHSWVDSLEGELSLDLTSLKYIFFDDILTDVSFTRSFFEHLTNLRFAYFFQIQFRCTCDSVGFLHWARNQQQAEVFMIRSEGDPHQCMSESGLQDLDSYGQAHCSLDVGFVMFVSTSCFLLMFMIIVLLHQLARDYLMAFYHIAHGWLNEALRHHHNTRGRYLYDAFVSYSGRDERWVMEKLLPNLEERGPPVLHLCLHSRDFQLGKDIVENITDSLYRSRRTICLVSRHYLRSNWCSLEMRLGTYRLQVEHRDVLILVFLEKIPSNLLSAHHRLARLVKTRTYLEWPQDPAQQEAFWDRLWKKLSPDRE